MAIEHGVITSKDGDSQHPKTCFSQVIDEDNNDQTLTEWRAEVAAALANAGSGSGGTTYSAGDGISISDQNTISVDGDWLDAKGYATSSDLTSATSGLVTSEDMSTAITAATEGLVTSSAMESAITAATEGLATSTALESAVSTLNAKDEELEDKVVTGASYDATTGALTLSGASGTIATVTVPSTGTVLQSAELKDGGSLELTWTLADESTTTTTIDLSALIDEYTSGTGITIADNVVNVNETWLAEQISAAITAATESLVTTSAMETAISSATSDLVTSSAMESAISTATSGLATTDSVDSAISSATADLVTSSDMSTAISSATSGLVSTTDMESAISTATSTLVTSSALESAINTATSAMQSEMETAIMNATDSLATQSALETLQATVESLQTRVAALEAAASE